MLDRSIAPLFELPQSIELVKAETIELENQSLLHTVNAGTQEVVRLEIIFQAGSKYETLNGVSYFTSKMLAEGTSTRSSKEITEYLELFGAFYELHHGPDSFNIMVYSLKKYLQQVIAVIVELIQVPTFPDEELNNLKNITSQSIKVNQNKTSYLASNRFKQCLFGDNPYGKVLDEEAINKIGKKELLDFFKTNIEGKRFDIVLSGNIDKWVIKIIKESLGKISVQKNKLVLADQLKSQFSTKIELVEKKDSLQSSLRLGNITIRKDHPDYFNLVLINEILGGYFGSRLMKNIREEKGFTYGISSSIVHMRDVSYFVIGTDVKKENSQETLDEIKKEIDILRSNLIPSEELETVKNYLIGTFLSSINTAFSLADKFKSIYFFNIQYSFYEEYIISIKKAHSKALLETANKYLDYDRMTKIVAGGLS
jgi:predicted Zn-dependent peptidase